MLRKMTVGLMLMIGLSATAGSALGQQEVESELALDVSGEERTTVALSQVPRKVMAAARSAAGDVAFTSAMRYWDDDFRVYRLNGRLFREEWNVYVREDGVVLRTESDNTSE